jgi:inner membrane protease subunit 1
MIFKIRGFCLSLCFIRSTLGDIYEDSRADIEQVPEGHCWVIGDNMAASRDSRHFGPMPMALIQGKAFARVFPWSERKWLENPLTSLSAVSEE